MKKAAIAVLFLAGAVVAAGKSGKMGGFGNLISDVQAEDELSESDKDQKEIIEESDTTEEDRVAAIDTSITLGAGSRIAVVSKATDGEYWKLVHRGMEDAVKDINTSRHATQAKFTFGRIKRATHNVINTACRTHQCRIQLF